MSTEPVGTDVDLDEWLEGTTPEVRNVGVCLDRTLLSRLQTTQARLEEIRKDKPKDTMLTPTEEEAGVSAELDQLFAEVKDRTRTIEVHGLGYGPWRDLQAKHPPAPDQAEVFARAVQLAYLPSHLRALNVNMETFAPAAIAACSELSVAQAKTLIAKAPAGVIDRLWAAVLEVNTGGMSDPFTQGADSG